MPIPRPACFAAPTVAAVRAAEAKARASGRAITGGDLAEAIAEVGKRILRLDESLLADLCEAVELNRAYEIGGDGYEVLVGNDRYDTVAYAGLCRAIEMAQWARQESVNPLVLFLGVTDMLRLFRLPNKRFPESCVGALDNVANASVGKRMEEISLMSSSMSAAYPPELMRLCVYGEYHGRMWGLGRSMKEAMMYLWRGASKLSYRRIRRDGKGREAKGKRGH